MDTSNVDFVAERKGELLYFIEEEKDESIKAIGNLNLFA